MRLRPGDDSLRHSLLLWGLVCLYFATNATLQWLVSPTADLDQAEQLLLAQDWALGYAAQPPLYTYLALTLFELTGPDLAALVALKVVLLSLLAGALIWSARALALPLPLQLVTVAGMVFVPQLIWESQRDLTHSVLATTLAAGTLLMLLRTERDPRLGNYLLLGLLAGLGLISKYNYAIFLVCLGAAALLVPEYRRVLGDRRILLACTLLVVVAAPHFHWMLNHLEIATSAAHKLRSGSGNLASGLLRAATAALAFLSPLWLFALLLLGDREKPPARTAGRRLLLMLLGVTGAGVALFVVVTGAQQIKDRWYQPLLFYAPLLVAVLARPRQPRLRIYLGSAVAFAVLVTLALNLRTLLGDRFDKYSRPHLPYPALLSSLAAGTGHPAVIFAESKLLGGNARPWFPESRILVPGYPQSVLPQTGSYLILCETRHCDDDDFNLVLAREYGIDLGALQFREVTAPYYYAPSQILRLRWAVGEFGVASGQATADGQQP